MARVEYDDVWKRFPGSDRVAVHALTLDVADGELLVLLGPSGCGKTTALRMLAGLEHPDGGDIRIDGRSVLRLEPKDRDVALVFQSYALYPHLSVRNNIGYPLRVRGLTLAQQAERIGRAAALLRIEHSSRAGRGSSPAASSSGSRSRARSCASPACSAWTSLCRTSTRSSARTPAPS